MSLISEHELHVELGVPAKTLAQWRYLGKGPAYARIGRYVRYRRQDVDAWIAAQVRGGAA